MLIIITYMINKKKHCGVFVIWKGLLVYTNVDITF